MSYFLGNSTRQLPKASSRKVFCAALVNWWIPGHNSDREQLFKEMSGSLKLMCPLYPSNMPPDTYEALLLDSVFSLCPAGGSPETFRLWESIAMGAIVVTTKQQFIEIDMPSAPFIV